MRNKRANLKKLTQCLLFIFVTPLGCSKGSFSWISSLANSVSSQTLSLAFLSPFNSPAQYTSASSLGQINVQILDSTSNRVTSGSYTVNMDGYTDSKCTIPVSASGSSVGNSVTSQNGIATLTPIINQVPAGTYYLKATASGLTSACSSSVTFATSTGITLRVPIELTDYEISQTGLGSFTALHSQTKFDPSNYDGYSTYIFEIVAQNTGTGEGTVSLVNGASAVVATIAIPITATTATRYQIPIALQNTNSGTYQLKVDGIAGTVMTVFTGRILVQQTYATKTQLYVPLLNGPAGSLTAWSDAAALAPYNSGASSYSAIINNGSIWTYNGNYSGINSSNPFTLETIVSASSGSCDVALWDTSGSMVLGTSMTTSASTATLLSTSFSASALTLGHSYQLATQATGGGTCYLYKAGLKIGLSNFTSGEIYFRTLKYFSSASSTYKKDYERISLDESYFSAPSFYFEATASRTGTATVSLGDCLTGDSDSTACSATGSTIPITSSTLTQYRSGALSITNGNRYGTILDVSSALGTVSGAFVVVTIQK